MFLLYVSVIGAFLMGIAMQALWKKKERRKWICRARFLIQLVTTLLQRRRRMSVDNDENEEEEDETTQSWSEGADTADRVEHIDWLQSAQDGAVAIEIREPGGEGRVSKAEALCDVV